MEVPLVSSGVQIRSKSRQAKITTTITPIIDRERWDSGTRDGNEIAAWWISVKAAAQIEHQIEPQSIQMPGTMIATELKGASREPDRVPHQ